MYWPKVSSVCCGVSQYAVFAVVVFFHFSIVIVKAQSKRINDVEILVVDDRRVIKLM